MADAEGAVSDEEEIAVGPADIEAAWDVLKGHHRRTPIILSRSLSEMTGSNVYLKFENKQRSGSYKFRGAFVKIASLSESAIEKVHGNKYVWRLKNNSGKNIKSGIYLIYVKFFNGSKKVKKAAIIR